MICNKKGIETELILGKKWDSKINADQKTID